MGGSDPVLGDESVGTSVQHTVYNLRQIKTQLKPGDVYTNDLVQAANKQADRPRAIADAQQFKLDPDFAATQLWQGFRM